MRYTSAHVPGQGPLVSRAKRRAAALRAQLVSPPRDRSELLVVLGEPDRMVRPELPRGVRAGRDGKQRIEEARVTCGL